MPCPPLPGHTQGVLGWELCRPRSGAATGQQPQAPTTAPPTASRPEQAAALGGLPAPSETSGAASTLRAAAGRAALHTPHHHTATVLLPKPAATQEAARHLLPGPHPPGTAPYHGTCRPCPLRASTPFPLDFRTSPWRWGVPLRPSWPQEAWLWEAAHHTLLPGSWWLLR